MVDVTISLKPAEGAARRRGEVQETISRRVCRAHAYQLYRLLESPRRPRPSQHKVPRGLE